MGHGASLLLGSGPSPFEATRQPSKGRPRLSICAQPACRYIFTAANLAASEVDKARRPSPDACPAFGPRTRPRRSSQASFLAGKQKERDHALDKAQHAEAALEALKDRYRELRRAEDHALGAVDDAAAAGDEARRALASESSALGRKKAALAEHLRAAETDRAAIFAETQRVEAELRAEIHSRYYNPHAEPRFSVEYVECSAQTNTGLERVMVESLTRIRILPSRSRIRTARMRMTGVCAKLKREIYSCFPFCFEVEECCKYVDRGLLRPCVKRLGLYSIICECARGRQGARV